MLSNLFLGLSLAGAEWVLYVLIVLSVLSIALIIERVRFYRSAESGLDAFREQIRKALNGSREEALKIARDRLSKNVNASTDLETELAKNLLENSDKDAALLNEIAQDAVLRARVRWEKNLSTLATIGTNAPFIGLFGTVLGIIQAFHDLSKQSASGVQGVTAGISEALVATAVGILVAIPATIAFNMFVKKVKVAAQEAEALKSYIIGKIGKK